MAIAQPSISRGREIGVEAAPRLALVPHACPPETPPAPCGEYRAAHDRLEALERLARLAAQGVLTAEEFALEKARLLQHPVDPTEAPGVIPGRGPSLLGRLLDWRLIPAGLVAGLAFSFATQRQETLRFFDEALRLFGA